MSPFNQLLAMVVYAFCAGLVAARVWRRVNNLNFIASKRSWSHYCHMGVLLLSVVAVPWGNGEWK